MAVPFSGSKAVKGCSAGFASVLSYDLFPIKTSAECRKAGSAPKQYEQKWYLLLFHIRVIREAGRLILVFRKCTELGRVVGGSLPCYPVIPLRSCDRAALIYHDQLHPRRRPHDIRKDSSPHSSACRSCSSHREVLFPLFASHRPRNLGLKVLS